MKQISLAFVLLFFSNVTLAADGSSGCGPAWYILKKNSLLSSSFRSITNGMLAPVVTLGMTFGTSNCSKHSIVEAESESLRYVENNLPVLRQDIARGGGESLDTLLGTMGCQFHETANISQHLQGEFSNIFRVNASAMEIVSAIENKTNLHPSASQWCQG